MSAPTIHKFQKSLNKAQAFTDGTFKLWYPNIIVTDGRKYDFETSLNERCELKLDFYPNSTNAYIESHSRHPDKLGGPWQTSANNVDVQYYVYAVVARAEVYWIKLQTLLEHMEQNKHDYRQVFAHNVGYKGAGYLVPLAKLAKIAEKIDKFS